MVFVQMSNPIQHKHQAGQAGANEEGRRQNEDGKNFGNDFGRDLVGKAEREELRRKNLRRLRRQTQIKNVDRAWK